MGIKNLIDGTAKLILSIGEGADKILLKNNSGVLEVRNYDDTDYVEVKSSGIGSNKTLEVGPGKEYTDISDALASLENKTFSGVVTIEIDPGTYVLTEDLSLESFNGPKLVIKSANPKELDGYSYCNGRNISATYSTTNSGEGVIALANVGNDITVTGTVANPDFAAAGLVSGDEIIVRDDADNLHLLTLQSVAGNVLTFSAAAPNVVGARAFLAIAPNVKIDGDSETYKISLENFRDLELTGIFGYNLANLDCKYLSHFTIAGLATYNTGTEGRFLVSAARYAEFVRVAAVLPIENSLRFDICSSVRIQNFGIGYVDQAAGIRCTDCGIINIESGSVIGEPIIPISNYGVVTDSCRRILIAEIKTVNLKQHIYLSGGNAMAVSVDANTGEYGFFLDKNNFSDVLFPTVQNMTQFGIYVADNALAKVQLATMAGNAANYSAADGVEHNNMSMIRY
jgi:hypothetical protein